MGFRDMLGTYTTLRVERLTVYGAALAEPGGALDEGGRAPTVLLPRREVREDLAVGEELEVFIYLDSEDRLTATLRRPRLALGEVVFLRATAQAAFGTFFDWGLGKELLVPHAEQTRDVRVGEYHPIGLVRDATDRLAGTMRIAEMLDGPDPAFAVGDWVEGQAWRHERGLGLFVILARRRVALLPEQEPHELTRGEKARFRVAAATEDGKVRVSLRGLAHTHIADDAEEVLRVLESHAAPRLGDHSDPDDIRDVFGLSKKAFKRAVGRLLKAGRVEIASDGAVVPKPAPVGRAPRA